MAEPGPLSEEALALIRWQEDNPNVWGDQDENGVDLARLRENLKLTPTERMQRMEERRKMLRVLKNARTNNNTH